VTGPYLSASAIGLAVLAAASAWMGWTSTATVIVCAAAIAALLYVKSATAGYNSFAMLFVAFVVLYGVPVPLDDALGIESLNTGFPSPHQTAVFVLHLALALGGCVLGFSLVRLLQGGSARSAPPALSDGAGTGILLATALTLMAAASTFEIVNFIRVGGLATLAQGKAVYQSDVEGLRLTLPSYIVSYVAVAAFFLFCAIESRQPGRLGRRLRRPVAAFVILALPLIAATALLTRRTELFAWVLIAFVGVTWFRPMHRLTGTAVAVLLVAYVGVAALGATRTALGTFQFDRIGGEMWRNELLDRLNPGRDEFATPYGVFNEYHAKAWHDPLRGGRTYLDGFAVAVPGFLWPGPKPRQIDYEVRDRLFPSYGSGSTIASAGFSPILEAYVNFGTLGVPAVYGVIGAVLALFEWARTGRRRLLLVMLYLSLLPLAQTFQRSAFGPSVISVTAMTVMILVLFASLHFIFSLLGRSRAS